MRMRSSIAAGSPTACSSSATPTLLTSADERALADCVSASDSCPSTMLCVHGSARAGVRAQANPWPLQGEHVCIKGHVNVISSMCL